MKFLGFLGRMIVWMVFITFCAFLATFFIGIFHAEGVLNAIEIVKGIFGG